MCFAYNSKMFNSSSTSQKLVQEDYLYLVNGSFGIITDCAVFCCSRSKEWCDYYAANDSETRSEVFEEMLKDVSEPWYV